jgi:hypothetical protein
MKHKTVALRLRSLALTKLGEIALNAIRDSQIIEKQHKWALSIA